MADEMMDQLKQKIKNEIDELHRQIEEKDRTIAELKKELEQIKRWYDCD